MPRRLESLEAAASWAPIGSAAFRWNLRLVRGRRRDQSRFGAYPSSRVSTPVVVRHRAERHRLQRRLDGDIRVRRQCDGRRRHVRRVLRRHRSPSDDPERRHARGARHRAQQYRGGEGRHRGRVIRRHRPRRRDQHRHVGLRHGERAVRRRARPCDGVRQRSLERLLGAAPCTILPSPAAARSTWPAAPPATSRCRAAASRTSPPGASPAGWPIPARSSPAAP
jgi:hypothetical protein